MIDTVFDLIPSNYKIQKKREYLKCCKAYDIICLGKKDVSAHVAHKKPQSCDLWGFSIPFFGWVA